MHAFLQLHHGTIDERGSFRDGHLDIFAVVPRGFDGDIDGDACLRIGDAVGNHLLDQNILLLVRIADADREDRNPERFRIIERISACGVVSVGNQGNRSDVFL